ncbi:hypothetical protein UlMin_036426 [Ulmus minor]
MVLRTNPGSMAILRSEVTRLGGLPHFQRIFICLEACKRGFLTGCRPVVGLDGCHLKGPYGGVLLAAISVEANMGYFPLAYAIAEIENQETWCWFLEHLKEAVGRDLEIKPWCIISDRQKGLVSAIQEILPSCTHRCCCHHILQNFQKRFKQTGLRDFFWEAAKAPNAQEFQIAMSKIRAESGEAYEWLNLMEASTWAFHAMDKNVKCEHITSNFVESFNAWIDEERYVIDLVSLSFYQCTVIKIMVS